MPSQLFSNNANSKLLNPISNVALSLQVWSGAGALFPAITGGDYFYITLNKVTSGIEDTFEIVKVTAIVGDVMTIERAQEGTTASAYAADDRVSLRVTAAFETALEAHRQANTGDNATNTQYASDYRAANFIAGTNYQAPLVSGTNYQAPLVSGTNIKTVNGESLVGSGDVVIASGGGAGANIFLANNFGAL